MVYCNLLVWFYDKLYHGTKENKKYEIWTYEAQQVRQGAKFSKYYL